MMRSIETLGGSALFFLITFNLFGLISTANAMNFTDDELVAAEIARLKALTSELSLAVDMMWVFVTAVGILSMQTGFALLEAGTVQVKNVRSILMKNLMDAMFGCIVWYLIGYGLYQGSGPIAAGDGSKFLLQDDLFFGNFVQQFGFAITSVTIVSGAVCSRIRFGRYAFYSLVHTGIIYPIAAHVCWAEGGFIYEQGFVDFAGSGVVHGLGGISALVGAYFLGPRVGRFYDPEDGQKRGDVRPLPEHNAVLIVLGGLTLFMGWFPFNAGSSGGLTEDGALESASHAMINTLLAASTTGTVVTLYRVWFSEVQDIATTINGILSGLVAITGPCASVEPWAAIVIGFFAAFLYLGTQRLILYRFHIDDPINAFAVHGSCGMYGVFVTGLFDLDYGLVYGNDVTFFFVQIEAIVVIAAWALLTSGSIFWLLTKFVGLRVSEHDQLVGLDMLYHQENAYPEFDSTSAKEFQYTQAAKEALSRRNNRTKRMNDNSVHSERSAGSASYGDRSAHGYSNRSSARVPPYMAHRASTRKKFGSEASMQDVVNVARKRANSETSAV